MSAAEHEAVMQAEDRTKRAAQVAARERVGTVFAQIMSEKTGAKYRPLRDAS